MAKSPAVGLEDDITGITGTPRCPLAVGCLAASREEGQLKTVMAGVGMESFCPGHSRLPVDAPAWVRDLFASAITYAPCAGQVRDRKSAIVTAVVAAWFATGFKGWLSSPVSQ